MNRVKRTGIFAEVTPVMGGGVGRYVKGLLDSIPAVDEENGYFIFSKQKLTPSIDSAPNFSRVNCAASAESTMRNHFYVSHVLPFLQSRLKLDVLHIPNSMPILVKGGAVLVTIHDLAEFALSERVYGRIRNLYRKTSHVLSARRADAIIAPSLSTKKDIVEILGIKPEKIHVIYHGIEPAFFEEAIPESKKVRVRERYGLPPRYSLFTGQIQPRKNLARIISAFAALKRRHPEHVLVIAGKKGWMYQEILRSIGNLGLSDSIIFTGYVPGDELPALYAASELFLFPSLYEGFGFPVLEAMAAGVPVITSDTSSLAEISGGASLVVDPTSEEAIADAWARCLENADLRRKLQEMGRIRAKNFTWEKCARETVDLYKSFNS